MELRKRRRGDGSRLQLCAALAVPVAPDADDVRVGANDADHGCEPADVEHSGYIDTANIAGDVAARDLRRPADYRQTLRP